MEQDSTNLYQGDLRNVVGLMRGLTIGLLLGVILVVEPKSINEVYLSSNQGDYLQVFQM